MALFRRSRRDDPADESRLGEPDLPENQPDQPADGTTQTAQPGGVGWVRTEGPWDRDEVDEVSDLMDFGSLLLRPRDGMQLHLEVNEADQSITGVTVVLSGSAVQLQAFAAPRSAGIWPEIRSEIAQGVVAQGGTAEVVDGPLGKELITRLPQRGADGKTVLQSARFLGVDGPRWFLRSVITGTAAVDPAQQAPALAVVRSAVVVRGAEAMAPRDLLPLRLPEELAASAPQPTPPPAAQGEARLGDFRPFERGPEITEIH